jgi:hypothetical protein
MQYTPKLVQGDTFDFQATYKADGSAVDLTGYTAEMVFTWSAFRYSDRPAIAAGELMATVTVPNPETGVILAHIDADDTGLIPASGVNRVGPVVHYQLRIAAGDATPTVTLLQGSADVAPNYFDLVT